MTGSVLFYVQHLLGIGHLRRALRIAQALAGQGVEVTLVSGGDPLPALACPVAARIIQLPPVRSRDAGFRELVGADGRPIDKQLQSTRRAALLAAFATVRPDALLIEAFPFGRRAFRFELDALIAAARSRRPRPLILCSLRDIVVAPREVTRRREIVARVRADFDFVLVHGDPLLISLEASFPPASEIADRLIYTGYVGDSLAAQRSDEADGIGEVLVSAGGGAVGGALLSTALETRRRGFMADVRWRLLAGPNLPEPQFGALANGLPEGVVLERFRPEFPRMLRGCRVSVSQAGYNTVLEILEARAAAVVVPFAAHCETEQSLRAETLAARGVLDVVRERELSPDRLADAMDRRIARGPAGIMIDMAGAQRSAAVIARLILASPKC
ncbi:MAG: glycosyl transferase [Alphaproteobacteria bacterium]|nr:glycosyl transferase [Alphaproteobacteria bacterium]